MLCDGFTHQEFLDGLEEKKRFFGYTKSGCEDPPGWIYTIGLTERGHPELIVAGVEWPTAASLVDAIADRVLAGERFDSAASVDVAGHTLEVVRVHERHWEDSTFSVWHDYYFAFGPAPDPSALQLLLPAEFFCPCHGGTQRRLRLDRAATNLQAMTDSRHGRRRGKPKSHRPWGVS